MSSTPFTEATVEAAALGWFAELGYGVERGRVLVVCDCRDDGEQRRRQKPQVHGAI